MTLANEQVQALGQPQPTTIRGEDSNHIIEVVNGNTVIMAITNSNPSSLDYLSHEAGMSCSQQHPMAVDEGKCQANIGPIKATKMELPVTFSPHKTGVWAWQQHNAIGHAYLVHLEWLLGPVKISFDDGI